MKPKKTNTKIAGVDVGKSRLDAAVYDLEDELQVGNDAAGVRPGPRQAFLFHHRTRIVEKPR